MLSRPLGQVCCRVLASRCFLSSCLLSTMLLFAGCASGPFNSSPSCPKCGPILDPPIALEPPSNPPVIDACSVPIPRVETDRRVSHLVFQGGGVKGTAYVGAIQVLGKSEMLGSVDKVVGTSAGAITALMVALGIEPDEIRRLALDSVDFRKFEDGSCSLRNAARLVERYGWYKGDFFLCFLECLIGRHLGDPEATFKHLADRAANRGPDDPHFRRLFVVGTNLNTNTSEVFSAATHPDMPIADAVRISMSIPLFFAAREAEINGQPDIFVDGGVLWNYPLNLLAASAEHPTLGFHLGSIPTERYPINNLVDYSKNLISTLLEVQVDALCNGGRREDVRRTVFIDPLGISTTDFDITRRQKCDLINSGARHTVSYFEQGPSDRCPIWLLKILEAREQAPIP